MNLSNLKIKKSLFWLDDRNFIILLDRKDLPDNLSAWSIYQLSSKYEVPIHIFRYNEEDPMKSVIEEWRGAKNVEGDMSEKAKKLREILGTKRLLGNSKAVTLDKLAETYSKAQLRFKEAPEILADRILKHLGYREEDLSSYV